MNGTNRHELKWQLIRSFFRSRSRFLRLFDRYERLVLGFAEELKTHRARLKLPADELLTLLDFKSLEELRDGELRTVKQIAHELFRGPDATDRFDHFVSTIYHELSILKEEHYTLKEDYVRLDQREYDRFFREVAEFYPKRLRHTRNLFGKALRRLEELLPSINTEQILVRSLFLFGEELLAGQYPRGLVGLYRRMYPEGGDIEGYAVAARSFAESGFEVEAAEAFRLAERAARRKRRRPPARVLDLLDRTREVIAGVEAARAGP